MKKTLKQKIQDRIIEMERRLKLIEDSFSDALIDENFNDANDFQIMKHEVGCTINNLKNDLK